MKTDKVIAPTGKMSNLVGLFALLWSGNDLIKTLFVKGKVDDEHYLIQFVSPVTGEPNVCRIVHIKNMLDWTFYPADIVEHCLADYQKDGANRYKAKLPFEL